MKEYEQNIFVTKSKLPDFKRYCNEIKSIWNNHWLTNHGELHQKFQDLLLDYLDIPLIELYVNGHMALDISIKALGLEGEVITTPFTFASTIHALTMNNIKPVFCDIKLKDYTIDEHLIESLITSQTSAILAVHVYGFPCEVEKIERIARKYNLKVIYDAAHAFGVKLNRKSLTSYGDISMLSFHATKVFNSIEGGALVYEDVNLKEKLYLLRNFGISGPENIEIPGYNAKMNEFSAAMGICNLELIDEEIKSRKKIVDLYVQELNNLKGIKLPVYSDGVDYNYSYFPILIEDSFLLTRDDLHIALEKEGIYTRKYFFPLATDYHCYKKTDDNTALKNSRYVSERILTLPLYGDLSRESVLEICNLIKKMKRKINDERK